MAASAENEPRRNLRLLKDVRFLYGRYLKFFHPVPASCAEFARTLSSLKNDIYRFDSKYNTGSEPLSVFCQLTLGLSDTLVALRRILISCARDYASDTLDESDWLLEFGDASMERLQARVNPISVGVEIINEAMEITLSENSGIRSSETIENIYKRIDEAKNSSARLQNLVNSFLHGVTVPTKLETTDGRDLHTFTSANIFHREAGQNIAARLKKKTQEAVNTKQEDEGPMAWKIRHSIYWLSKSSEDLRDWRSENDLALSYHPIPASDKAWHTIAKIFLDALKAAWLLEDLGDLRAYKEPSFEIQEVVACAKKKVLGLLQSFYTDIFTVPNYDLINELGDFGICTEDERELRSSQLLDPHSIHSSPVSEAETNYRQPNNSTFPVELEACSLVSLTDSNSHHIPSELSATSSIRRESSLFPSKVGGFNTTNISALADGLHITNLEDPSPDHENIDRVSVKLDENESSNAESESPKMVWAEFQYNVFSIESNPPHNTSFIRSRVRIFKLDSQVSSYLRLITYREALPTGQSVIQPSTAALIPAYAFAVDRSENSELYISDSGMQPTLRYTFHCKDSNGNQHPWELYGFQGALMGAYLEGDYSPASVSLHRHGSLTIENERFPRIQVWTDFPSAHPAISDSSSPANPPTTSASLSPLPPTSGKDFSALASRLTNNVNDSKIFIFSSNFIYVLFVSDRVTLNRPEQGGILLEHEKHKEKTCVRFIPNKHKGASAIRVRTLKGTRDMPAGIPLDRRGIRYGDQERADGGFDDFQSIEVEFDCEDGMSVCYASFLPFPVPFLFLLHCHLCLDNINFKLGPSFFLSFFSYTSAIFRVNHPPKLQQQANLHTHVGTTKKTDAAKFVTHFQEYVANWRLRCAPVDPFRELQKDRHITVSSATTFQDGAKRRRSIP